jgi:hypothetical protein
MQKELHALVIQNKKKNKIPKRALQWKPLWRIDSEYPLSRGGDHLQLEGLGRGE